jgi:hypothetical protein
MVWLNRSALARRPLNFRCGGRTESLTDYCTGANGMQTLCEFKKPFTVQAKPANFVNP